MIFCVFEYRAVVESKNSQKSNNKYLLAFYINKTEISLTNKYNNYDLKHLLTNNSQQSFLQTRTCKCFIQIFSFWCFFFFKEVLHFFLELNEFQFTRSLLIARFIDFYIKSLKHLIPFLQKFRAHHASTFT